MFNKLLRITFSVLFLAMLTIPLMTTNLKPNKISKAENRRLASKAVLHKEDGNFNENFTKDFESWINDNIGFRSKMVVDNAKIQYYVFGSLANNSNLYLGPRNELNYATEAMLKDYQHLNLYSDKYLCEFAESMQVINDYVKNNGAQFYYYQCWDKHSIYPEYFPATVCQFGEKSKTDGIVKALNEYSDVKVISPKQDLLNEKKLHSTYSVWGDPTHWNPRGAYVGYLKLMNEINANSNREYKILEESDYNITSPDQGYTAFGGIHEIDHIEKFDIKSPKSILTNEKLTLYNSDQRHRYYTNHSVDNNTKLLIIGDSYFESFIVDDLAESFYETILIWGDYLADIKNIIDIYDADIVIVEAAERVDRTSGIIKGAQKIKNDIEGK